MSQENVEGLDLDALGRAAVGAINRDDLDGFLELVHPEVEFTSMIAEAEGETFRGHEGVRRWWDVVRGAFSEVLWTVEEVRTHEDRGVAKIRIEGTLSGVEVSLTMWQAAIVRDGMAVWWGFFRAEGEALEAVG